MKEQQDLKQALTKCNTLHEALEVLKKRYDLENCKLGLISKPMIIEGLVKAYDILKPAKK